MFAYIMLCILCVYVFVTLVFVLVKLVYYVMSSRGQITNKTIEEEKREEERFKAFSYWKDANIEETGILPSHAKFVYSTTTPVYIRMNDRLVLSRNGQESSYTFLGPKHQKREGLGNVDQNMFVFHFFDLKNFEPSDKDIEQEHLDRSESYAVIESVMGGFLHYDENTMVTGFSFKHEDPIENTFRSDNRFFKIKKVKEKASPFRGKYQLCHMSSEMILSSSAENSFVPLPTLVFEDGSPKEHTSFTLEPVASDGKIRYSEKALVRSS